MKYIHYNITFPSTDEFFWFKIKEKPECYAKKILIIHRSQLNWKRFKENIFEFWLQFKMCSPSSSSSWIFEFHCLEWCMSRVKSKQCKSMKVSWYVHILKEKTPHWSWRRYCRERCLGWFVIIKITVKVTVSRHYSWLVN